MNVVILAGGRGTRLGEETDTKPKPMVEIGSMPIIVHIMRHYARFGYNEFTIALGYKGHVLKTYFANYGLYTTDMVVRTATGDSCYAHPPADDWTIHLIDTGQDTQTGGRLGRLRGHLRGKGTFMLTYGDGVANVDIGRLVDFHKSHGRVATVTAVRPPGRFGAMTLKDGRVDLFKEKPQAGEGWINGGFFVFEPRMMDYISGDDTMLEQEPLERLAADGELMAYRHEGFWHAMDTGRDRDALNDLWDSGCAPWCLE